MKIKRYSDIEHIHDFIERYRYLKLDGVVGRETFGSDRWFNQMFYASREWKRARRKVILRDLGCDLGIDGYDIPTNAIVHHINPIDIEDIRRQDPSIVNPEFLICVSGTTHKAIHYSNEMILANAPVIRTKHDTCPWKK